MSTLIQRHLFTRIGGHGDSMNQDARQTQERHGDPAMGDRQGSHKARSVVQLVSFGEERERLWCEMGSFGNFAAWESGKAARFGAAPPGT
jgi:hypothetical protein